MKRAITVTGIVLLLMGASLPWVLSGSQRAVESMFNAPVHWISSSFAGLRRFRQFVDQFDVHETILVSWPGCTVDDPRLREAAAAVEQVRATRQEAGEPELFAGVANGYDLLRELTSDPVDLSRTRAIGRLTNVIVGPDGETSCLAVDLTALGAKQRREAIELLSQAVEQTIEAPRAEWRITGPPVDGVAIDDLSVRSIEQFSVPSALLSLALCWLCLRSGWFTAPIVAVAAFCQGVMLASVHYAGASMNAVLIVLPPLVFVLAISAGVHFVNYFYEEMRGAAGGGGRAEAVGRAVAKAWRPTALAAITTALGLASLLVSEVSPVREFGLLGALGVLLACALLFLLLPGAMIAWPLANRAATAARGGRWSPLTQHRASGGWDLMARWIGRRHGVIVAGATLLLCVMALGFWRITTSLNIVTLLDPRAEAIQDYNWFQDRVAPLIPVEIVVRFEGDAWDALSQAQLVSRVHYETLQVDLVDGALSPATFIPPVSQSGSAGATMQRALVRGALRRKMPRLVDAGYVRDDEAGRSWRVSGRVRGRGDVDYGAFLDRIRERIDPVIAAANEQGGAAATVSYTGVTSAVYEVQRALLDDLFVSFLAAVALVGAVMILVLRSVRAGVAAMLPNVFPTVVLFGGMGWLGISIDVGSVMTASVALGIAVDGTFHFLASFKRERLAGENALNAIRMTYQHCGRALVQTALICAAGMLPFVSSSFLPARSFAWMLLLLLLVAAVGDLIVLPALLASPAGKWFVPRVHASSEPPPSQPVLRSTSSGVS